VHHTASSARGVFAGTHVQTQDLQTGKDKLVLAVDYWLDNNHKQRRDVEGYHSVPWPLMSEPRHEDERTRKLNVFSGWGDLRELAEKGDPECAETRRLLAYIEADLCAHDPAAYEYVLNWLAHLLQRPHEKPGVALVITGEQGTGKSTLNKLIARMLPAGTSTMTSNREQLFGRFTIHLLHLLHFGAEELVHGGNHREDSAIKDLITSTSFSYEEKNQTPFVAENYTRFVLTSNSWRPVSTHDGKRRYLILQASDEHKGNRDYWRDLYDAMRSPAGIGGLMRFLDERDLWDFDPAAVPKLSDHHREAEVQVEVESNTLLAFMDELLVNNTDGEWIHDAMGQGGIYSPGRYTTSALYDQYERWASRNSYRDRFANSISFGTALNKLLGVKIKDDPNLVHAGRRVKGKKLPMDEARRLLAHKLGFASWDARLAALGHDTAEGLDDAADD
jgi:hypothetical protein